MIKSPRVRVLIISLLAIAVVAVVVWVLQRRSGHYAPVAIETTNHNPPVTTKVNAATPTLEVPAVTPPAPSPTPSISENGVTSSPTTLLSSSPNPTPTSLQSGSQPDLIVPVAGVQRDQLRDTFSDARSEGRRHDAIDIPAAAGTPVLAVAGGEIIKLFQSDKGGTTIYQLSADKKLVYYYAHLQRYADAVVVGKPVRQGEVIAYVGDTGNAGPGNYHLHFSISLIADPKRYWEGTNINPYPILRK
ncbi:MAG: M23 family metallopeptidase [bacterium]